MAQPKLNSRQQKFVDAYSGNATDAARKAGYSGNDGVLGATAHNLLKNPKIALAIRAREADRSDKLIATRAERQQFWTKVANDTSAKMPDRLRASELLGKSEADFTEKVEHSGALTLEQLILATTVKTPDGM